MFNLKTFERQMCSGSQSHAWFSSCLMFTFVFSLYSTSPGPTIHLDYDLLECDAMQVHRYQRFGRTWCFFRSSKFQRNTVACESGYTASRKTKLIRLLTSSGTSKLTTQLHTSITIRSFSLLVCDSPTNPSISPFNNPVRQLSNMWVLDTYISIFIYLLTKLHVINK